MGRGLLDVSDCFGRYLRGTGPHSPSLGSGQSGPDLHIDRSGTAGSFAGSNRSLCVSPISSTTVS